MTRTDALNAPPMFCLPSGEVVYVWITESPVAVYAQARNGGAYVTVSLFNADDSAELGGEEETMIGGHAPRDWARLRALAYATVSLFDDTGRGLSEGPDDDYLSLQRLKSRCDELRRLGAPPFQFA